MKQRTFHEGTGLFIEGLGLFSLTLLKSQHTGTPKARLFT